MSSSCLLISMFSDEKPTINLIDHPYPWWAPYLLLFSGLFSLSFDYLTMECLGVELFEFILLWIYWAFWMCKLMFFIKFGKFSYIISSNILSAHFSLSSLSKTFITHMLVLTVGSHRSLRHCSFFLLSMPRICYLN